MGHLSKGLPLNAASSSSLFIELEALQVRIACLEERSSRNSPQAAAEGPSVGGSGADQASGDLLASAMKILDGYKRRRRIFGDLPILGDPSWEMIIDLFVQNTKGRTVCTGSACLAANIPQTTGLRLIAILERMNLIRKCPDAHDKRRTNIELTDHCLSLLRQFLGNASAGS